MKDLKEAYRTIEADHFAPAMEISFINGGKRQTFQYEKVTWNIGGEEKGLRYGENPGQEAALYKLVNGNLVLGDVEMLQPGQYLASVPELLQSGKHPGKTNVTDTDNALNILRYLMDKPADRGHRQAQQPVRRRDRLHARRGVLPREQGGPPRRVRRRDRA